MSSAKAVLEPAFQGVGHKPYPLSTSLETGRRCTFFPSSFLLPLFLFTCRRLAGDKYKGMNGVAAYFFFPGKAPFSVHALFPLTATQRDRNMEN
jgi:hypothetical protein